MHRYRLTVEYDGTRYSGWQVQQNARSVQGALIDALVALVGPIGAMVGSGRTDAGVHALAQVAHVDLPDAVDPRELRAGLNDRLHHDICVLDVARAPERFHARHSAVARSYVYQITRNRGAFTKRYTWWVDQALNVGAMRRAGTSMIGMRDFAAFTEVGESARSSTKVMVDSVEIAERGQLIVVRVRASHFLRRMVRRVVGALVDVGRSELAAADVVHALEEPTTPIQYSVAPASGLFLEQVIYPGESFTTELAPALTIGAPGR